jgi:hypothetical protein
MYDDPKIIPKKGSVKPFLDLIEHSIPNSLERNRFLDYIQYLLENPTAKIQRAILLKSYTEGTGKSLTIFTVAKLFGDNAGIVENRILAENYNKWAKNKRLAIFEEVSQENKKGFENNIKTYITSPTIQIREMYTDPYEIDNYLHIIAMSNADKPFLINKENRRWEIYSSNTKRLPEKILQKFLAWQSKPEYLCHLLYFFKTRKYSKPFNPGEHAIMTEAKNEMITLSKPIVEDWIEEMFIAKNPPFDIDVITSHRILDDLDFKDHIKGAKISDKYIVNLLKRCETKAIPFPSGRLSINNVNRHVWIIRNHKKWIRKYEKDSKGTAEKVKELLQ